MDTRQVSILRTAVIEHALLLAAAFVVLAPFIWMISVSVKPAGEIFGAPLSLIPHRFAGGENYATAFNTAPLLRFMLNGLIVVLGILAVQVSVALFAAYALAKLEYRGRGLLLALVIIGLCVPVQAPALPLFLALARIRALDTYFALMMPFFLSVFAIFLFRQFIKGFPDEIIAAARLDGFTELEIVLRLILPSAKPAIAAFAVFSIVAHWNDLFWPLIVVSSLDLSTPPLGILYLSGSEFNASYGPLMAGAVIITSPLILIFVLAQRQFVRGITMTGIK